MTDDKPGSGIADTDPAVADTEASAPGTDTKPSGEHATVSPKGPRQVRSGDTLGRYELGPELGEGGMATVFSARDKELRRDVAVKVLFPHLARRTEIVRRFQREARAAAGLEHANILRIYDVGGGSADDPPFMVMELIQGGRTLLEEIERHGPILAEVAACIGALLADALAAAHAKGIVHRDIKPSNVLVAPGGRLLLADFGVARLETDDSSLVTRTGALLGTPAYMSPEQASGDTATAKSDLYSLGATLYQLATGTLPYSGSPAKVMSQIASGSFVAPVRRSAAVGPDLSRIVERLMATEPGARPESAASVATELRAIASAGGLGDPADELASYFEDPKAFLARKTPSVVTAIVTAGKRAIAESRLPRAIALADRAAVLAPEDPAVKTLVESVTAGDRASRRRKLALALGGLALAGGGVTAAVVALGGGATASSPDAAPVADARIELDAERVAIEPDAAPGPVQIELADAGAERADAAIAVRVRDAGARVAVDATVPVDAAVVADAAPSLFAVDAAVPEAGEGKLIVENDTWCEISIDGVQVRRLVGKRTTLTVAAGRHSVTCSQGPGRPSWSRDVVVEAGKIAHVGSTMLATVDVTISIAGDRVQINDQHFPRGSVAKLRPGRYRAVVLHGDKGGAAGWLDIPSVPCRLHEQGTGLVCDP